MRSNSKARSGRGRSVTAGAGRHGIGDLRRASGDEAMLARGFDVHEEVGAEVLDDDGPCREGRWPLDQW